MQKPETSTDKALTQNLLSQGCWTRYSVIEQLAIWNSVRYVYMPRLFVSLNPTPENYGFVLRDCSKAISLNAQSSKAHYRSAMALLALERFEEAQDCCTRCLDFDPTNTSVRQLLDRAQKGKLLKEKKVQERAEQLKRVEELKRELNLCYKARHLIPINDPHSDTTPYSPHLNKDPQFALPVLVIPVFFLYPQYATSDLISHYDETVAFSSHLHDMFPTSNTENPERRPEWDKKGQYLAPDLVVYAITHKKRLLKVGKRMSLLDLCDASKGKDGQSDGLEVKNGCLSVAVLPKGEVERHWVEEFKATR
ncbi:hypothetical protein JB92DRAFT_2862117 [Gautieria morchelliformis]|nr:hypothetical protein JB92DRAFT_2862117 [Gautieria morchelliformis]